MTPDTATNAILDRIAQSSPFGPGGELIADWSIAPWPAGRRTVFLPTEPVPGIPNLPAWATVRIIHIERERLGLGPIASFGVRGEIRVSVFVPLGTGSSVVISTAWDFGIALDSPRAIATPDGAIQLTGSRLREVPPDPENAYLEAVIVGGFAYTDSP